MSDDIIEFNEDDFPIWECKCKDCKHLMCKLMQLTDQSDLESYEFITDEEIDFDTDVLIVKQYTCLLNAQDIDGIILECNKYKLDGKKSTPFDLSIK